MTVSRAVCSTRPLEKLLVRVPIKGHLLWSAFKFWDAAFPVIFFWGEQNSPPPSMPLWHMDNLSWRQFRFSKLRKNFYLFLNTYGNLGRGYRSTRNIIITRYSIFFWSLLLLLPFWVCLHFFGWLLFCLLFFFNVKELPAWKGKPLHTKYLFFSSSYELPSCPFR